MIKISHALAVTLLGLVLITGYFNRMLDDTRNELFALQEKVHQNSQDTWGVLEFDVTVTMYTQQEVKPIQLPMKQQMEQ